MKLSEQDVMAMVAVKDLAKGKEFYGDTLGLKQSKEIEGVVTYKSGNSVLVVYQAPTAGTNQATCAGWMVADIKATVSELKEKGVTFEHYDMPGMEWDGDIASWGTTGKAAWFKDPDGNTLDLNQ